MIPKGRSGKLDDDIHTSSHSQFPVGWPCVQAEGAALGTKAPKLLGRPRLFPCTAGGLEVLTNDWYASGKSPNFSHSDSFPFAFAVASRTWWYIRGLFDEFIILLVISQFCVISNSSPQWWSND
jgi:hypothetical protein